MPTVVVHDKEIKQIEKQTVDSDLFWYDAQTREMLQFKGGYLDLVNKVYDHNLQRFVPSVKKLHVPVSKKVKSRSSSLSWFRTYENYNITEASVIGEGPDGLLLSVPSDELDSLIYDLERNGIEFTVE